MKNIFDELFYNCRNMEKNADCTSEISTRLEKNEKILKSHLNKREKKLLLRIIDDKDLIKEEISVSSFIEGFKLGLKLGYESNRD